MSELTKYYQRKGRSHAELKAAILELAGQRLSQAAICRRLHTSPVTVRRHAPWVARVGDWNRADPAKIAHHSNEWWAWFRAMNPITERPV